MQSEFHEQFNQVQNEIKRQTSGINSFEFVEVEDNIDTEDNNTQNIQDMQNVSILESNTEEVNNIFAQDDSDINDALLALNSSIDIEEMTVTLPGIKTNIVLKPLKYEEEIKLSTNRLSPYDFAKRLNKILLNYAVVTDPLIKKEYFKNQTTFEKKVLAVDRSIMLFGLLINSFEKLATSQMQCTKCEKTYTADVDTKNLTMSFDTDISKVDFYNFGYTQKLLNGLLEFNIGINPEWVRLELLKTYDNDEVEKNVNENENFFSLLDQYLLYIKEITVYKKVKDGSIIPVKKFTTKNQKTFNTMRKFIYELPLKVKEKINNELDLKKLDEIIPRFESMFVCPYCGHIDKIQFNPELEFFRKALSLSI